MTENKATFDLRFMPRTGGVPCGATGVFAPARWRFGPKAEWIELGISTPNVDANGSMLAGLEDRPDLPSDTIVGIFAADPFVIWDDVIVALQRAGIRRIINYPTICVHEGPLIDGFEDVEMGHTAELARLKLMRKAGFGVIAMACSLDAASQLATIGPEAIALHAFCAVGTAEDGELVGQVGAATGLPILLHGGAWHDAARRRATGDLL